LKQPAAANFVGDILQFDQALGLAIGGGEIDLGCSAAGRMFRSASSSINSPALSILALDFRVRAFAPRRSHSISE